MPNLQLGLVNLTTGLGKHRTAHNFPKFKFVRDIIQQNT